MKADRSIKSMSNRKSEQFYWQEHLAACKANGMKKSVYCRQHGINYDRMMYWQKKIKDETPSTFVRVKMKADIAQSSEQPLGTLVLPGGYLLKIHDEKVLTMILDK